MIDENLPTFFLKNDSKTPQQNTIYHRQHGNDPEPAYTLRALDPAAPASQNRYGVALCDPYVPDVVFGEVAVIPEWTQPSMSADTIRANGGAPPPAEPILPVEFTIQLYNPDQTITVKHQPKSWNKPARWEFEMPQRTFRFPSASTLDRTQSDPAAADVTPKLRFSWRKDGKLSKDLTCLLHGKSTTIADTQKKSREPDITVALFQGLRELTLYEPNLYRVEMEDFKGLEVVLLLAAVAIRDIFFGLAKEAFHITAGGPTMTNGRPQPVATPAPAGRKSPKVQAAGAAPKPEGDKTSSRKKKSAGRKNSYRQRNARKRNRDKSARLKSTRKQNDYKSSTDKKSTKLDFNQLPLPDQISPPRHSGPSRPYSHHPSQSYSYLPQQTPTQQPPRYHRPQQSHGAPVPTFANGPYMHAPGGRDPRIQSSAHIAQPRPQVRPQSTVGFYPTATSTGALQPGPQPAQKLQPKKSSFFGFRRNKEEDDRKRLDKKRSSMF
ncbi:hypothetical protein N7509_010199 [Penicillium cosmopolitanum]|uniref:Uncharacterized protein n=1 Tax=Penicillium cosmopolitanum TaxID=1131564 RepID=A0A9W9VQW7_9EURO|nr:uncharacterized protein N7509_010199 [Penicillium cosmopolitanum]KAJ5387658.1 hypothetical protein N7509_010199 [Penicillium cosmopolitanum]